MMKWLMNQDRSHKTQLRTHIKLLKSDCLRLCWSQRDLKESSETLHSTLAVVAEHTPYNDCFKNSEFILKWLFKMIAFLSKWLIILLNEVYVVLSKMVVFTEENP